MKETWILGISILKRTESAVRVQDVLAKFGCSIRTRLGLHETGPGQCSGCGMILLELSGDSSEFPKLENELLKIEDVEVKKMVFKRG